MSTLDDRPPPPPPHMAQAPAPAAPPKGRAALPPTGRRLGRRTPTPVSASPQGLPTRRRWGRFAAGATLALLGAWIFAALYVSAGERVEVLVASDDIDAFTRLTEDHFNTVRVAADPTVETVRASDLDDMVDRITGVPILKGTLLSGTQLIPKDQALVEGNEEILTLSLDDAAVPDQELLGGVLINVIIKSNQPDGEPRKIPGCWILRAGEPNENTRKRKVALVVPASSSEDIGAAALDNRIVLSALGAEAS